jgi:hypothetical protein
MCSLNSALAYTQADVCVFGELLRHVMKLRSRRSNADTTIAWPRLIVPNARVLSER